MSFWCLVGLHDWQLIWDDDSQKEKDINFPFYDPNRVCLRCEKKDMRATRFLERRKARRARADEILGK